MTTPGSKIGSRSDSFIPQGIWLSLSSVGYLLPQALKIHLVIAS